MELNEHTGHGIPVIVAKYGRDVFHIGDSYIDVAIPFDRKVEKRQNVGINVGINKTQKRVLQYLLEQPDLTAKALAAKLELSSRTIERALRNLQKANLIQRIGSKKNGS